MKRFRTILFVGIVMAFSAIPVFFLEAAFAAEIRQKLTPVPGKIAPLPVNRCNPIQLSLYVKQGATQGNGSSAAPYATLSEALDRIARSLNCSAEVLIFPGTYIGGGTITVPTKIEGIGTGTITLEANISNPRGNYLHIRNVQIGAAPSPAISQIGGRLNLEGVKIGWTHGKAVILNNVEAKLNEVEIFGSQGQALHAEGPLTKIWANALKVTDNKSDPAALLASTNSIDPTNVAAFEVAGGGQLWIGNSKFIGNDYANIQIRSGAKAHLRGVTLSSSRSVPIQGQMKGGENIIVNSGGILEIHDFLISNAQSVGLTVYSGYLLAQTGQIRDNPTGLAILGPSPELGYYAVECVDHDVIFSGNSINNGGQTMPFRSPNSNPALPANCRKVPWQGQPTNF